MYITSLLETVTAWLIALDDFNDVQMVVQVLVVMEVVMLLVMALFNRC